jgi:hypothetical protein
MRMAIPAMVCTVLLTDSEHHVVDNPIGVLFEIIIIGAAESFG